jgi:hypothetical protein
MENKLNLFRGMDSHGKPVLAVEAEIGGRSTSHFPQGWAFAPSTILTQLFYFPSQGMVKAFQKSGHPPH